MTGFMADLAMTRLLVEKAMTTLEGFYGDDVYIVRKGEGNELIFDFGGNDTLELHGFTEGDLENIVIKFDGTNLNFSLNDEQFLSPFERLYQSSRPHRNPKNYG